MFCRAAVVFNSILIIICCSSYFVKWFGILLDGFLLVLFALFQTPNVFLIGSVECLIIFAILSFLFVLVVALISKIKVGKPPVNGMLIAYKYGLSDSVSSSSVDSDNEIMQGYKRINICYERRVGPFGIAHGAVIGHNIDQVNLYIRSYLNQNGYHIFNMKPITNAVYITSPTLPWLKFFGVWLVLRIVYPKMYKFSKAHKLSAYPVIEVYDRFSVVLVAPLSRQDDCVVPEADSLMNRSCSRLDISSFSTTPNRSLSHIYSNSPSKSNIFGCEENLITLTEDIEEKHAAKLIPIFTSTPKTVNGHVIQSVEE